jgi:hypothetical protein
LDSAVLGGLSSKNSNDAFRFGDDPTFMHDGVLSGTRIINEFRSENRLTAILNAVIGNNTHISAEIEARWINLQKLLKNTDAEPGIYGNIVGELWEQINLRRHLNENRVEGENLFTQFKVYTNPPGKEHARIDLATIDLDNDSRRILINLEEYKAGDNTLTDPQKVVKALSDSPKLQSNAQHFDLPPNLQELVGQGYQIQVNFSEIRGVKP